VSKLSAIEQWVVAYLSKKPEKGTSMTQMLSAFELAGQDLLQQALQHLEQEGVVTCTTRKGVSGRYVGLCQTNAQQAEANKSATSSASDRVPLMVHTLKGLLPVPVLERLQSPTWRRLVHEFQREMSPYQPVPLLKRLGIPKSTLATLAWCTEDRLLEYLEAVRSLTPQDRKSLPKRHAKRSVGGLLSTADSVEPNEKFALLASLASARIAAEALGVERETIARAYRVARKQGRQTQYVVDRLRVFEETYGRIAQGFAPPACLLPRPAGAKSREKYDALQRAYEATAEGTADQVEWSSLRHSPPKGTS
jgi:DNA-binding transcriptional regulator YhcF (GntR family)